MIEIRPVVFRMLNAVEAYCQRIGVKSEELERAVHEWLDRKSDDE